MRFNYKFENKKGMKMYKKEFFIFSNHTDINFHQTKKYNAWKVRYKVNRKAKYKYFNVKNKCLYKTKREAYKFLKERQLEEYHRLKKGHLDIKTFEYIYNPNKKNIKIEVCNCMYEYHPLPNNLYIGLRV